MASGEVKSCEICMNTFEGPDRKAVALPCGHDFCLTCLVRLRTAGSHKCPKCRGDWAELEVQALPGMTLGAAAQEEEGELLEKGTKEDYWCRKHQINYDFWSIKEKMFCCKKCIIELGLKTSELQLIDDAMPIIKSDIAAKYVEFSKKIKHVSNFRLKIQLLEEKIQESLRISETPRSKRFEDSAHAKKVDNSALAKKVDDSALAKKVDDSALAKKVDNSALAKNVDDSALAKKVDDSALAKKVDDSALAKKVDDSALAKKVDNSALAKNVDDSALAKKVDDSALAKKVDDPALAEKGSDFALAKKVDDELKDIKSEADIARMVSSMTTLETLTQPCRFSALLDPESLLCNIACTYMECEEERSSSAAFIRRLLKATADSVLPLTKAVFDADVLMENHYWFVQNSNCLAALLALDDRQPGIIRLISRPDEPKPLPAAVVAAVAEAARDCEIRLELYHTFFKPENQNTYLKLLEHSVDISSLRLVIFFGHLDAASITKLPTTITRLGLAIGCAADAAAVSGFTPWENLYELHVSVSSHVAACDLSRLPRVRFHHLYFPDLTDASVNRVRPVIEALLPSMEFRGIAFPLSQLTAAGIRHLGQQLRGAVIDYFTIEPCGSWRPGKWEMDRIDEELRRAVKCPVPWWDMDWLYKR